MFESIKNLFLSSQQQFDKHCNDLLYSLTQKHINNKPVIAMVAVLLRGIENLIGKGAESVLKVPANKIDVVTIAALMNLYACLLRGYAKNAMPESFDVLNELYEVLFANTIEDFIYLFDSNSDRMKELINANPEMNADWSVKCLVYTATASKGISSETTVNKPELIMLCDSESKAREDIDSIIRAYSYQQSNL